MSRGRWLFETGSTVVLTVAALVVCGFYLSDRLGGVRPTLNRTTIETWEEDNEKGLRIGPADAEVVITEFMDFQCPYCAGVVPVIDSLRAEFPEKVAVVFQHYPLSIHGSAIGAAIASECAHQQGRFDEMYHVLFSRQDSFGITPWSAFAREAGVQDTAAFNKCLELPQDSFPRIGVGLDVGARTGVRGTPTFWVNGRVSIGGLSTEQIRERLSGGE